MIPTEMLDNLKDHLDAPDNFWSNERLWRRLQEAQNEVIRDISKEDPTFFVETFDISFVANQATYEMPVNAGLGTRVIFGENTDSDHGTELPPARLRKLLNFSNPSLINLSNTYHFTFEGPKVRVIPTPTSSKAAAIRMWFVPSYGHMMQGVASAGTTTTLAFATSTPNWTLNYGWKDTRDDYYNGMHVHIYDGTNAGEVRRISDYTGGTSFTVTVDTAFTSAVDTTSKYAILCPVPEGHHGAVCLRAALLASIKGRTRTRELSSEYYGHLGRPGLLKELLSWVSKRQDALIETVIPNDIGA